MLGFRVWGLGWGFPGFRMAWIEFILWCVYVIRDRPYVSTLCLAVVCTDAADTMC